MQLKYSKNKKKNVEETTVHTMMVQETTVQETPEEDTTQEESAEVVDREVVEEFFENEISTENEEAFELPPRQLTDEFIPYDGQKREITCYGDSMMAGAGSATEGKVNGIDIYGFDLLIQLVKSLKEKGINVGLVFCFRHTMSG